MRMAHANQCPELAQPCLVSLPAMTEAMPTFARLTGVDEPALAARLSVQALGGDGRVRVGRIGSASVGVQAVRWQERFVCPECVAGGIFSSVLWELAAYQSCDLHRLTLISTCSACPAALTWETGRIDRCTCGLPLAQLPHVHAHRGALALDWQIRDSTLCSLDMPTELRRLRIEPDPRIPLDALLLFIEYARSRLEPAQAVGSDAQRVRNAQQARAATAIAVNQLDCRRMLCGRFDEIAGPIRLGRDVLSERSLIELEWMFAGRPPKGDLPFREHLSARRRRWQGVAPALVEAEPFLLGARRPGQPLDAPDDARTGGP